jgi:S1-C subfamily serine protease
MKRMASTFIAAFLVGCASAAHAQTTGQRSPDEQLITVPSASAARGTTGFDYAYRETIIMRSGTTPRPQTQPRVEKIDPQGPAARAGMAVGDVILSVNGRDAREPRLFPDKRPGTRYLVRVRRGTVERELTLVVAPRG